MGLIEEALRKSAQQRKGPRGNQAQSRFARPSMADVKIPQYQPAAIDARAKPRRMLLPSLSELTVSRAYKILRTRVTHRLVANSWHSVGITGTVSGEGKILTAVNLALALAQDVNNWVFLIDLDL